MISTTTTAVSARGSASGPRVSGKEWKISKQAFRTNTNQSIHFQSNINSGSFNKRLIKRKQEQEIKEKLKQLKTEKQEEKLKIIEFRKLKQERILEKERLLKLSQKFNEKRIKRLQKRQKRNKLLNER